MFLRLGLQCLLISLWIGGGNVALAQTGFAYSDTAFEKGAVHATQGIYFAGKQLHPKALAAVDSLAEFLNRQPGLLVRISVHVDRNDYPKYEVLAQKPDQQQAEALKIYLIEKGIDSFRMVAVGEGFYRPKATALKSDSLSAKEREAAQKQNRRVEITIIGIVPLK
ncbi:MAG: OmpA family protein [Salibacteraceae bacterium]